MPILNITQNDTFATWLARTNEIIDLVNGNSLNGTSVPGAANAFIKSDANGLLAEGWLPFSYLKTDGGNITGPVDYTGVGASVLRLNTKEFIRHTNEANPLIQSDDRLFLNAGNTYGALDVGALPLKSMYITADGDTRIITNLKPGGYLSAKQFIFGADGSAIFPGSISTTAGITANSVSTGTLLVSSSFSISGAFTANTLSVTSNATVGGSLTVTGNLLATSITETSDFRLKEKIAPLKNALAIVSDINGVKYNLIGSSRREIGVIAQEVERVAPELVETGADGMKSVNYARMTALLIEAVKELQHEVATLKKQQ